MKYSLIIVEQKSSVWDILKEVIRHIVYAVIVGIVSVVLFLFLRR